MKPASLLTADVALRRACNRFRWLSGVEGPNVRGGPECRVWIHRADGSDAHVCDGPAGVPADLAAWIAWHIRECEPDVDWRGWTVAADPGDFRRAEISIAETVASAAELARIG